MKIKLLLSCLFLLPGCAIDLAQINFDDPRCFTKTDYEKKYQSDNNKLASVAALLSRDMTRAMIYSGNSGISWEEGLTGDERRLWVGYSDDNRVIGYRDVNGIDLSVAELTELGGIITRRSNFLADRTYFEKKLLGYAAPEYGQPVLAKKRPASCSK
jgi:hypothetical protein